MKLRYKSKSIQNATTIASIIALCSRCHLNSGKNDGNISNFNVGNSHRYNSKQRWRIFVFNRQPSAVPLDAVRGRLLIGCLMAEQDLFDRTSLSGLSPRPFCLRFSEAKDGLAPLGYCYNAHFCDCVSGRTPFIHKNGHCSRC